MIELGCILISILCSCLACNIIFASITDIFNVVFRFLNQTQSKNPFLRKLNKRNKHLSYIIAYLSLVVGILGTTGGFSSIFYLLSYVSYPSFDASIIFGLNILFSIIYYLFGKQCWNDAKNNAQKK